MRNIFGDTMSEIAFFDSDGLLSWKNTFRKVIVTTQKYVFLRKSRNIDSQSESFSDSKVECN
jgi:hypothetical protein